MSVVVVVAVVMLVVVVVVVVVKPHCVYTLSFDAVSGSLFFQLSI